MSTTTQTITTTFSFLAKTKSGIILELFASNNDKGEMRVGAKSETGYSNPDVGHFAKFNGVECICLGNKYINEDLIGVKAEGYVPIDNFNPDEVESVRAELKRLYEQDLQRQIDSLEDNDIVHLRTFQGGYGKSGSLKHDKLSYEAGKKFDSIVTYIEDKKLAEFVNTDPWADYSVSLQAEMTYADFKKLQDQVTKIKEEAKIKKNEAKQKELEERKSVEEEELFIFDAGVIYSSAGNKMLHSLGATFSEKTISIYTTAHSRDIKNANTTYSIKDTLKKEGFAFNPQTKNWDIDNTEANAQKVIDLLKKYDSKAWPDNSGMVRCWECGCYFKPKKGDHDGFDYYCGC